MDTSSNPIRHGWPRSAPPKLRCEAPPPVEGGKNVYERELSDPYAIPRHKTFLNGPVQQLSVHRHPIRSLDSANPGQGRAMLHGSPRISLPTTISSTPTKCNRRAVLIAATYSGTKGISRHSDDINHVLDLFRLLTVSLNFREEDVWLLTDAPEKAVGAVVKLGATRRNILTSLKWLVAGSKSGDILFFGFSGLGGTVTKHAGEKASISEDCLLPSDYPASSPVHESELSSLFSRCLHVNASLTTVLDSRDGSKVLRLPYIYGVQCISKSKFVVREKLGSDQAYSECERVGGIASMLMYNRLQEEYHQMERKIAVEERDILASAFLRSGKVVAFGFSGVSDQHHRRLKVKSIPVGALTRAFVNCVSQNIADEKEITYRSVLSNIVLTLAAKRYSQLPQITSSQPLDVCASLALLGKVGGSADSL